jgi:hypothetical protein
MKSLWMCLPRSGAAVGLSLALALPTLASAGTVAVADGTKVAMSFDDVSPFFAAEPYVVSWFAGVGVHSGEFGMVAPVGQVSVNDSGPGAITIDWGTSIELHHTLVAELFATNFSLSVADKLIYADITITAPDGGPTVSFTHLDLFALTDLSGDLDGVALDQVVPTNGPGLLNLNAKVSLNPSGISQINVAFGAMPYNYAIPIGHLVIGVGAQPIPEPGTWTMMGLGLAGLVAVRARRRRAIS